MNALKAEWLAAHSAAAPADQDEDEALTEEDFDDEAMSAEERAAFEESLERGLAQCDAGDVLSMEEVKRRLEAVRSAHVHR
ncbi:MAG: hypothetical protein HQL86_07010 [Magnetococcales bacterium]|nr:hypothetical protein [Magnetococcales bacterium]